MHANIVYFSNKLSFYNLFTNLTTKFNLLFYSLNQFSFYITLLGEKVVTETCVVGE